MQIVYTSTGNDVCIPLRQQELFFPISQGVKGEFHGGRLASDRLFLSNPQFRIVCPELDIYLNHTETPAPVKYLRPENLFSD